MVGARCPRCGARYEIRVHFDRGCALVQGGDHYHRICRCELTVGNTAAILIRLLGQLHEKEGKR